MRLSRWTLLLSLIVFGLFAANSFAQTSVWKVSKGDHYFYLGGTIHLLTASDHPLPQEFSNAYNDSSVVIFETDLTEMQSPQFQSHLLSAMTYSDSQTLETVLNSETYQRLETFLQARQIPISSFANYQPWAVSMMTTLLEYQRFGMMPEYGVDAHLHQKAKESKKILVGLETPEDQLRTLQSLASTDPNEDIHYLLADLEGMPEIIEKMKNLWRIGDIEAIASMESIRKMESEFPEIYEKLITRRNNSWMKKIVYLTDDSPVEFLLVGALHLPGENGLLNQLESSGFLIEQLGLQ